MSKSITYPQYRKYSNNKSYYKIISSEEFEEIQVLGSKITFHHFKAKILPDRNYISDLTFDYHNHWEVIEEKEYIEMKKRTN